MRILFTICGRAGSKGLKNKNLKEFLGYPLPFYTVSVIDLFIKNNLKIQSDIVLNTDSQELISLFEERLKIQVDFIERASMLAQDNTPKIAVILNSLQIMKQIKNFDYDMVVDLDITSPLRTVKNLSEIIQKKANSTADVIFSVTDSRRNPYFNMVKKTDDGYQKVFNSSFTARQQAPDVFDMNASLYAYSTSFLEKGIGLFEGKCDVIKMMDTAVLDIDSQNDFELMQVIAKYLFSTSKEMSLVQSNIRNIIRN